MQDNPFAKYAQPQQAAPSVGYIAPNPNSPGFQQRQQDAAYKAQDQAFKAEDQAMQRDTNALARERFDYERQKDAAKGEDGGMDKDKLAIVNSAIAQLNRVEQLYSDGLKNEAFGYLSSLAEYFPSDTNRTFNSASSGLADIGIGAFRIPGSGTMTDSDAKRFAEANAPSSSDRDVVIEEKIRTMKQRLKEVLGAYGMPDPWAAPESEPSAQLGGEGQMDRSNRAVVQSGPGTVEAANGSVREVRPDLAGANDVITAGLRENKSNGEIIRDLAAMGIRDGAFFADVNRQINEYKAFREKNPQSPLPAVDVETYDRPTGAVEQLITDAAMSPGGSAAINFADGASMGLVGSGNEDAMNLSSAANPGYAIGGQITGTLASMLGGEAALAGAGMKAGLGRSLIADAVVGGGTGFNRAPEGEGAVGAINGASLAALGTLGGYGALKGVSKIATPTGGSASNLYAAGVRPTPGQRALIAAENSGSELKQMAGRAINATEEALGSVPVVGSAIRGARAESIDQFQIGAFNQALGEIGQTLPKGMKPGTAPHQFAQKAFDAAYDKARSGMRVVSDQQLMQDMTAVGQGVANLSDQSIRRFGNIVDNVVMRRAKGSAIDGDAYKAIVSDLGKQIRGIRKSPSGDGELADALQDLQGAIDAAARRHSPPDAVKLMDEADRGYAKYVLIENASGRVGGKAGEFTPTAFEREVQKGGTRVRSKAFLQGEGLMQDYAESGKGLVDRVPNSGTPERLAVGGTVAGGAAYLEPTTLGILGAMGALYSPLLRKGVKGIMSPRSSKALKAIGAGADAAAPLVGSGVAAASIAEQ